MDRNLSQHVSPYYEELFVGAQPPSREYYAGAAKGLARRLKGWLPASSDVRCVELGCGRGEMLFLLGQTGVTDLTGVDITPEQLAAAGQFTSAKLVCSDVVEYLRECPDESVDFFFAMSFLEHLDTAVLPAVLADCRRVLRPGGALIAQVPNAVSLFGSGARHWDISHQSAFTVFGVRQLARSAGFEPATVDFREWSAPWGGPRSTLRAILWRIVRLKIMAYLWIECGGLRGGIYTWDMLFRMVK